MPQGKGRDRVWSTWALTCPCLVSVCVGQVLASTSSLFQFSKMGSIRVNGLPVPPRLWPVWPLPLEAQSPVGRRRGGEKGPGPGFRARLAK